MKRTVISIILFMMLLLSDCGSDHEADTVKNGTYVMEMEGIEEVFLPCIEIADSQIIFSYDLLSSYRSVGSYTIDDGKLTMTTDDNQYTYVFQIDVDDLIFQKEESSTVKLIDDRLGTQVTDHAKFHRKKE